MPHASQARHLKWVESDLWHQTQPSTSRIPKKPSKRACSLAAVHPIYSNEIGIDTAFNERKHIV